MCWNEHWTRNGRRTKVNISLIHFVFPDKTSCVFPDKTSFVFPDKTSFVFPDNIHVFPADLNDLLLSKERVLQNNSLDLKSLRLKLDNMVAERNTYEQTLHEMNGRHVKQAREEYDSNEASRRRLMNHIVTLRLTVATLHESNGGEHVG